jgi:hypothetical protein
MAPRKKPEEKTPERIWARVTVGMAGVHRGQLVLVDPEDETMAAMLRNGQLVAEP